MKRKSAKSVGKKKKGETKTNQLLEKKKNMLQGTAHHRHSPPKVNYPGDTPSWP